MANYNRYSNFTIGGTSQIVPFIKIPKKTTDIYDYYTNTRLDLLSYQYYNNPNYGWLILQANPELGSMEFEIPQHTLLRIPYPLEVTISQYEKDLAKYNTLYQTNK